MKYKIVKKLNYGQESVEKRQKVDALCAHLVRVLPQSWQLHQDDCQVVFSIGGDGTMMHTMSQNLDALVVGINAGNVGFLTPFEPSALPQVVRLLECYEKQGDLGVRIEQRALLEGFVVKSSDPVEHSASVHQKISNNYWSPLVRLGIPVGSTLLPTSHKQAHLPEECVEEQPLQRSLCVNEFAISGEGPNDMLPFDICVVYRGKVSAAGSYKANSLLVSAPCGSTAYNMNAGGAIVDPTVACMQLLLIAPTMLGARPWIVGKNSSILVRVHKKAHVYSDGLLVQQLDSGSVFEMTLLPKEVRLLLPGDWNFYSVLSSKLHWNNGRGV